jgi:hypothetical protein
MGFMCKSIAYAIRNGNVANLHLVSGIFNESTVIFNNIPSLAIFGAESTIFNCGARYQNEGAAFIFLNSSVAIHGVTFQNCSSVSSNGGAVSAFGSSLVLFQCHFVNCTSASGGAVSVAGPGIGLFLVIQNSSFLQNRAIGGMIGCPSDSIQPCSTWGGAVSVFDISNISISDCLMVGNVAKPSLPSLSPQKASSRNAIAGGGCVSILFQGNATGTSIVIHGNTFIRCQVISSEVDKIIIGNGVFIFIMC